MGEARTISVPEEPRFPTSLMFDDPTSSLREQHIVSLVTDPD